MEYSVNKTYDGYKCYVTITFTESVIDYFRNNRFSIGIDDLITRSYLSIVSFTDLINNYSIKADTAKEFTTIDNQLNNSLIKNNGLIITFIDNKTIQFILIPRCKNRDNENVIIGFCDSNINIHFDNDELDDIHVSVTLFPKITRSDTLDKLYSGDPVLPDDVDRCCYTYPNIYDSDDTTIKHNVSYPTESQIYVNTITSARPVGGSTMVPVYYSNVSAIFTEETSIGIIPDWSDKSVSSVLYNDKNMSYISVPYKRIDEPTIIIDDIVIQQTSGMINNEPNVISAFTTTLSSYNIMQFVYAENLPLGRYENNLFFGLDVSATE